MVTVCAVLVAAGAVYVAEVVVVARVPPPLRVQVTPALFLSLVTVAVSVTVFAGSTVVAADDTATLTGWELLPPHPDRYTAKKTTTQDSTSLFMNIDASTGCRFFDGNYFKSANRALARKLRRTVIIPSREHLCLCWNCL
jgi:hypothetical protein